MLPIHTPTTLHHSMSLAGRIVVCAVALVIITSHTCAAQDLLQLGAALETVGRVYRQITTEYVDEVEPSEIATAGIEGMLSKLDPYSIYMQGDESEPYDRLSSGTYVGFGYTVGSFDGKLIITDVRPALPAAKGGLKRGDRLCSVDGVRVDTLAVDSLLSITRGLEGTTSHYRVTRNGRDTIVLTLTRRQIPVQNVASAAYVSGGIGYIELVRFSRNAAAELRDTLVSLKKHGDLNGLILDLRGNPGGLLDAAVSIANLFLPQGTLISYTVDRTGRRNEYLAVNPPFDARVPLVILVDEGSASASEVLTGAMQDQDRAVVVGRQSFGKGLVQNMFSVNDSTTVKLTTARYYTPSGRCVQRRFRQDPRQDSTTAFYSRSGRRLVGSSGIVPDSLVNDSLVPPMLATMYRSGLVMLFASEYAAQHPAVSVTSTSTSKLVDQFIDFVLTQPDHRISRTVATLRQALDSARAHAEPPATLQAIENARKSVIKDLVAVIRKNSTLVETLIKSDLAACTNPHYSRNIGLLPLDRSITTAINIIVNDVYTGFLIGDSPEDQ